MNIKRINTIFTIIIVVIFTIGGAIIWQHTQATAQDITSQKKQTKLYQLELSVPSMFCAGCTESVENYISIIPGVISVTTRLTPARSATIIYDPSQVTIQQILANEIFTIYSDVKIILNDPVAN